ncbi:MAG: Caib/baif family protein [Ilumatobacteraceae bacterium]|nr:Caib/baif family protein [Ilumatobacteraceae bacterium]
MIKVEPPGGDDLRHAPPLLGTDSGRSAMFEYLNASKESVVAAADSSMVDQLLARADVVVLGVHGDADEIDQRQSAIGRDHPNCVRVVTSPFGLTGPYRDLPTTPIVDWAASGYMFISGHSHREPLQGGGPFPAFATGLTAAIGALASWREVGAGRSGSLVDVGCFESMAALHQYTISMYTHQGYIKRRAGNRHAEAHHPVAFLECADGWVCIAAAGAPQWEHLAAAVGAPELASDPRFQTAGDRYDHADEVDAALRPWLMSHSAADVARILQDHRVPASPVVDVRDVLGNEQLRARGFLHDVEIDGRPAVLAGSSVEIGEHVAWSAAPSLGEHTGAVEQELGSNGAARQSASRPSIAGRRTAAAGATPVRMLEGVRVVDMTRAWAGPLAGRFLADLGADVIHFEYPTARAGGVAGAKGYDLRAGNDWTWGELPEPALRGGAFPDADPGPDPWNRQGFFNKLHRNKKSICVDLHDPAGAEVLRGLVAASDVVLENYSPRGAAGLGVLFDTLRTINPNIVVVSVSGYGHTGPAHDRVALGPIIEAESGLAALTGYARGEPMKFGAAIADAIAGLNGAVGVLAALAERDRRGEGVSVDLSMLESFVAIGGDAVLVASASGRVPQRRGNRSEQWAPQGVYRCAGDDEWIALTIRSRQEWHSLVELLGAPPLTDARFGEPAVRMLEHPYLDHHISAWTAQRTKWEAWHALRDRGVAAMPVLNNADLVHDPQLASRGFMVEWDQPGAGRRQYPGMPIRFDPPFDHEMLPAAPLGGDNRSVLRDVLGYTDATIDALERDGVIATRPDVRARRGAPAEVLSGHFDRSVESG